MTSSVPWVERPTVELDLSRPPLERFQHAPPGVIESARELLDALQQELPGGARRLAYAVRLRTGSRFHAETAAMARLIGADWRDLTLANISYELVLALYGCSAVALATAEGPVLARNMDWWPETPLARASYLFRCSHRGQWRYSTAGWPGAVGVVTGMSARGFAVALNAVIGPDGLNKSGYPVLLHLRRVLEDAADYAAALDMLASQRLAASALFTLVGSSNDQRVVVERTCTRHALRSAHAGAALVTTNDYRLLLRPQAHASGLEIYETTCDRFDSLVRFLEGREPDRPIDDAALLYILTDPSIIQTITAQHVIMRPGSGAMRVFVPRQLLAP